MNFFNSAPNLKFTRLHARIVQEDGAFTVRKNAQSFEAGRIRLGTEIENDDMPVRVCSKSFDLEKCVSIKIDISLKIYER